MFQEALRLNQKKFNRILTFFVCFLSFVTYVQSEEVCKFTYRGSPTDLNETTLKVPEEMVAMSEYVYVNSLSESNIFSKTGSIVFLIDGSGSMSLTNDKTASRFTVPNFLLDSIYKINPKTQIGLVVFIGGLYFNPDDDDIFESCPKDEINNGFIPLLTLDSLYNGEKGIDILKKYFLLDTTTIVNKLIIELKYEPSNSPKSGTNISIGFDAVKQAMESSIYPKERHYTIFFSDGEATEPENNETKKFEYIKGENVPTTFTVFFTPNDTAFDNLKIMNENIKKNGYSLSNPLSSLYTIETEHDKLMKLLMNNVIGVIIKENKSSTPKNLTVNKIKAIGPWDKKGFPFSDLFPLEIYDTDFKYKVGYQILIDSIIENGDTITVKKDTTTKIKFTVSVDENAKPLPDTFTVEYWDRNLKFYYKDKPIKALDETMAEVEIRFKEKKVDVLYGYKDVSIKLSTREGKKQDEEKFKLSKKGDYFSYKFKVVIDSTPTKNDGKLQVNAFDKVVALFKNPKLPRDTLQIDASYKLSNVIELEKAYYFDNDAQGHIDSMFIRASGEITKDNVKGIVKLIKLPKFRNLKINKSFVVKKGIGLRVSQDLSKNPITYVTKDDILKVKQDILPNGGWVMGSSIPIIDKIAPIIHWKPGSAHLIENQDESIPDTLTVKFSEPIENVKNKVPFHLMDMPNKKKYSINLKSLSHQKDQIIFEVLKINNGINFIKQNDSIWIYEGDRVVDDESNAQNNSKNIRRAITLTLRTKPLVLTPQAISPYNISDKENGKATPKKIVNFLKNNNTLNDLELDKNKNNEYTGMLIQVVPNNYKKLYDDFLLEGTLSIYDALGNIVIKDKKMEYYKKKKRLVYIWNCRNSNKRFVEGNSYCIIFNVIPTIGGPSTQKEKNYSLKLMVGLQK